MSHTFYKDNDAYVFATGKYPKGFANVLYITWEGSLDSIHEHVQSADQLKALTKVKAKDVPDNWWNAFAEASKLFEVREFEEFVAHCAAGTDPITAVAVSGWAPPSNPCSEEPDAEESKPGNWFALVCLTVSVIVTLWVLA